LFPKILFRLNAYDEVEEGRKEEKKERRKEGRKEGNKEGKKEGRNKLQHTFYTQNPLKVVLADKVRYRVEWERHQRRIKERHEAELERERVAYAQVDWHDFVVVQTVDFQPHETASLPPPCQPKDVGARCGSKIDEKERMDGIKKERKKENKEERKKE